MTPPKPSAIRQVRVQLADPDFSLPLDTALLARQLADLEEAERFERAFTPVFEAHNGVLTWIPTPPDAYTPFDPKRDTPLPRILLAVANPAPSDDPGKPTLADIARHFDATAWTPSYLVFRSHVSDAASNPRLYAPLRVEHVIDPQKLDLEDVHFTPVASRRAPLPRGTLALSDFPALDTVRATDGTLVAFEWIGPDPTPEQLRT